MKFTMKSMLAGVVGTTLALGSVALAHPGGEGRGHHRGHGMSLEKLDTDGDGTVSLLEMQTQAQARFERKIGKLDANGDGVITQTEKDALAAKMEGRRRGKRGQRFLQKLPEGDVSVEVVKAQMLEHVAERFAKIDTDNSGALDAAELEAAKAARKARWQARKQRQTD